MNDVFAHQADFSTFTRQKRWWNSSQYREASDLEGTMHLSKCVSASDPHQPLEVLSGMGVEGEKSKNFFQAFFI